MLGHKAGCLQELKESGAEVHICILSYDFFPPVGGQGVEAFNLYRNLRERHGIEVSVISGCRNTLEGHISLPVRDGLTAPALWFSMKLRLELKGLISGLPLDLLQVYGGPGGVMLAGDVGFPVLYVANHTYAQQRRFLGRRVYGTLAALEKRGYEKARHIVAISHTTCRSLIEDYGIKKGKVTVIPVGIDVSRFRPLKLDRIENSMLFVGRLCERKGIFTLLEACDLIRGVKPGFRLFIVGEGEVGPALKARVREMGLQENVIFLGRVSEEELIHWYNRVEVFCLPSLFEGFGIVCLEAMACGTPLLASRSPGIVDVVPVEHGDLLFEPGNAREIAEKTISLMNDVDMIRSIGESLRKTAETEFDWRNISSRFVEIYGKVLDA